MPYQDALDRDRVTGLEVIEWKQAPHLAGVVSCGARQHQVMQLFPAYFIAGQNRPSVNRVRSRRKIQFTATVPLRRIDKESF